MRALEGKRIAFFSRLAGARGGRLDSGPYGTRVSSGVAYPIFNWVLRTDCPEAALERHIASTLWHFRELGLPFMWAIAPDDQPAELPQKLLSAGFEEGWSAAMALDLDQLHPAPPSPGLTIEPVRNTEDLQVFARTLNAGDFQETDSIAEAIPGLLRPSFSSQAQEADLRCFLGYLDGSPVATSARLLSHGLVGIWGVATVPEARRRGFGASMTTVALADGRELGYDVAGLIATRMGEPVYRRLGFNQVYRVGDFHSPRTSSA